MECYFLQSCKLKPVILLKASLLHGCFARFLNCKNSNFDNYGHLIL